MTNTDETSVAPAHVFQAYRAGSLIDRQHRRLVLGRALLKMRACWPASGPRAKGWGDFLFSEHIDQDVALIAMKYARIVDENPDWRVDGAGGAPALFCVAGVYFVQGRDGGPIKIGVSSHVARRIRALQIGCPVVLVVIGIVRDAGPETERQIHERLASERLHGEWFTDSSKTRAVLDEMSTIGGAL